MQPSGLVHFPIVFMLTMHGEDDLQMQASKVCCRILVHVVSQQITDSMPRLLCPLNADSYHRHRIRYPCCVRHHNRGFDQRRFSGGHLEHRPEHTIIAPDTTISGRTPTLYKVSCGLLILQFFSSPSSVTFSSLSFLCRACL